MTNKEDRIPYTIEVGGVWGQGNRAERRGTKRNIPKITERGKGKVIYSKKNKYHNITKGE